MNDKGVGTILCITCGLISVACITIQIQLGEIIKLLTKLVAR